MLLIRYRDMPASNSHAVQRPRPDCYSQRLNAQIIDSICRYGRFNLRVGIVHIFFF